MKYPKVWMSWSSGKDSAFALYKMKQQKIEVSGLFTTVNESANRVAMHAVRESLLQKQAEALNLPLHKIQIPSPCSEDTYNQNMSAFIEIAKKENVTHFAFGDLFLEDVRQYRVTKLLNSGIEPIFPIWRMPTNQVAREIIAIGQKTVITCIDPRKIAPTFAGRYFDESFLEDLPPGVDPCGEQGEFHSFVFDSPLFSSPLNIRVGEILERDGFVFADVIQTEPAS